MRSERTGPDASLLSDDLIAWFNAHWHPEMGAIDGHDIRFIADLLARNPPKTIVEIGCASGLSTAVLGAMMGAFDPSVLHSFDLSDRFYADPGKPLGYLVEDFANTGGAKIEIHPGMISLDADRFVGARDCEFCFIDANHSHPWPILDTLAMLPLMKPGSYIVHHDLRMYQADPGQAYANGPKMVLDQVPHGMALWFNNVVEEGASTPLKTRQFEGNVFAIVVPEDIRPLAWSLAQGLYLPWDPLPYSHMNAELVERLSAVLDQTYEKGIGRAFQAGVSRYNDMIGQHFDFFDYEAATRHSRDRPRQGRRARMGNLVGRVLGRRR